MLKVSHLPRKDAARQSVPVRRQTSADIDAGTESATPATQMEPEVLKVSRLRRPSNPVRRRATADIYDVLKVPGLLRKWSLRC